MADPYLSYWYAALASDLGVCVLTDNRERLRQRLYAARAASGDTSLEGLSLVLSPLNQEHVWILKNGHDNEAT